MTIGTRSSAGATGAAREPQAPPVARTPPIPSIPRVPWLPWLPWLIGPLCLVAAFAAVTLVLRGPTVLFGVTLAVLFGAVFLWIAVSVFFPAIPDRTCPECAADALQRLDPRTTRGLRCARCGWEDESASSFYLAEEEGPLEPIVLRDRRERATAQVRGPRSQRVPESETARRR